MADEWLLHEPRVEQFMDEVKRIFRQPASIRDRLAEARPISIQVLGGDVGCVWRHRFRGERWHEARFPLGLLQRACEETGEGLPANANEGGRTKEPAPFVAMSRLGADGEGVGCRMAAAVADVDGARGHWLAVFG